LSALDDRLKSRDAESHQGRLTQDTQLSRLALLNLVLACGNSREKPFNAARLKWGGLLPPSAGIEQLPESENLSGFLIPAPKRP
jgi:hypothetical protein